jgi:hypothetical protein
MALGRVVERRMYLARVFRYGDSATSSEAHTAIRARSWYTALGAEGRRRVRGKS